MYTTFSAYDQNYKTTHILYYNYIQCFINFLEFVTLFGVFSQINIFYETNFSSFSIILKYYLCFTI